MTKKFAEYMLLQANVSKNGKNISYKNLSYFLIILSFGSAILNVWLLLKINNMPVKFGQNKIHVEDLSSQKQRLNSINEPRIFTLYIKPHPPDFNEGRRIQFSDFKILVEDSGIFVIFTEIKDKKLIQTKVDSEAILWR